MVIRCLGAVTSRYLYQILKKDETIKEFNILAESRSGTFPQITFDTISYFPIIVPSKELQDFFMDTFQPIINKQEILLSQIKTISNLRDTLLPKLISGELRVNDVEEIVEGV